MPASNKQGPAAQRYGLLKTTRDQYLSRARACALLTIPTLIPPEGANSSSVYYTPFQSVGSRGVNALAAKFLLAVMPPNAPSFRYLLDDFTVAELAGDPKQRALIEEGLNQVERSVTTDLETSSVRAPLFETIKHLLVAGNYLLYSNPETGAARGFPISSYVCKRSPTGKALEIITYEKISALEVPEKHRDKLQTPTDAKATSVEDLVEVYTHIVFKDGRYHAHQEMNGIRLEDTVVSYDEDNFPWFPIRLIITPDDYGRSYVEELYGDLRSLEGLTKALVKGGAIAAKVLFLLRPGAASTPKDLTQAETGEVRVGVEGDVSVVQADKYADFGFVLEMARDLEKRLGLAFLLNSSVQRNGERVTAEEIRLMVHDLDASLGGLYSALAQDFQLPFIKVRIAQMQARGKLPRLPKEALKVAVTTGVEAIGRGYDLDRLSQFFGLTAQLAATPDPYIDGSDARKRIATALQLDPKGLVKTKEEVAQEQQDAFKQQAAMTALPNVINKSGDIARDQQAAAQA